MEAKTELEIEDQTNRTTGILKSDLLKLTKATNAATTSTKGKPLAFVIHYLQGMR